MSFVVIIPARFASTRLPGKPLQDINGKPMIVHLLRNLSGPSGGNMDHRLLEIIGLPGL